jgi:caffeoyl-CoA O-methyltransferase
MKKRKDPMSVQIADQSIEKYAQEMTTLESEALRSVVSSSDEELEYIDMLSGNLVGQLLKMLIRICGAERVLEIGTFTGYSALTMAEALPDKGEVITVEMNLRYQEIASKHFEVYDTGRKITLLKGNARELVGALEGSFDLIFIDADKLSYEFYYDTTIDKLDHGGIIVVDNVLWDGTVLEPGDPKSEALDAFNRKVAKDDRVEQVMLPVRDGVTLIRKK